MKSKAAWIAWTFYSLVVLADSLEQLTERLQLLAAETFEPESTFLWLTFRRNK